MEVALTTPSPESLKRALAAMEASLANLDIQTAIAQEIDAAVQRGRDKEHQWYQRQLQLVLDAEPVADSTATASSQNAARTMLAIFRDAAIRARK